jgi:hypothetical protein
LHRRKVCHAEESQPNEKATGVKTIAKNTYNRCIFGGGWWAISHTFRTPCALIGLHILMTKVNVKKDDYIRPINAPKLDFYVTQA